MAGPLLQVKGLQTHFTVREGVVRSADGVDLTVNPGETLCVVGESGCGKSVTARSIMQLVSAPGRIVGGEINFRPRGPLDHGPRPGSGIRKVWRRNRTEHPDPGSAAAITDDGMIDIAALDPEGRAMRQIRGSEISMVFQEPMASLSPVHTIGHQLVELLLLHEKLTVAEAKERAIDALQQVGMPSPKKRFDSYSFELSGGMRQRAMIALAIACEPQLLIADEPTTALDVTTQRQILDLLQQMQDDLGMAIMFITHDLGVVAEIADRVAVMYLGMVVEECDVYQLFESPRHPYTQALLQSIPHTEDERQGERLTTIRGTVPHPLNRPDGCPFSTRCDHVIDECTTALPPMVSGGTADPDRAVRCLHFPDAQSVTDGIDRDLRPDTHRLEISG